MHEKLQPSGPIVRRYCKRKKCNLLRIKKATKKRKMHEEATIKEVNKPQRKNNNDKKSKRTLKATAEKTDNKFCRFFCNRKQKTTTNIHNTYIIVVTNNNKISLQQCNE